MSNPIKKLFDLYTSDLSYYEIERLIKQEAAEVYEFFKKDIPKPEGNESKAKKSIIFIRSLFNAFIMKLSPARRIFYLIALLIFLIGFSQNGHPYVLLAFIILNALLAFELADKLTVKNELEIARKIQLELIPKHPIKINKYEIASIYKPAKEVGGDYFDVVDCSENRSFIVLGDISGKGMAAALYMVKVQAILHLLLSNFKGLKELLISIKKYFSKNLRKEYFLTLIAACINKDGSIDIVRAGHPLPLYYKNKAKKLEEINVFGIGIGLNDKGIFERTLSETTIQPEKDDIVIFYTDGITETMNYRKEIFGEKNLQKIIVDNSQNSANEIKNIIINSVDSFRKGTNQSDDLTLVVLKAVE
ncbi:PP2C family protein-serine/threonine phosphatase [Melioribacteraceae bacterium 4301-Me]|uniref:PP2C family protein-serine/threonine phosphatase n=1 Tax=Pyranulibacter aquaticus TaxID=3163344 RepID=UPI00359A3DC8